LIDTCAEPDDLVPRLAGARLAGIQFDAIVIDDREGTLDLVSILRALRERSLQPARVVIDPLQPQESDSRTPIEFTEHIARPLRIGHLFEALIRSMNDSRPEKLEEPKRALPAEPEPVATTEVDEAAPRVLLAEDNEVNQKIAVMTLKRLGCVVEVANDGREAVKQARKRNFDIIFMDCQMPVMDGFDATRAIRREEPKNVRVPIVALTANVFAEDREHCLEVGMDGFLPKPVTSGELREILTRFASKERVQGNGSSGL
ncbi:MAG: response regulator, partial [Planctomycetota bacterium]